MGVCLFMTILWMLIGALVSLVISAGIINVTAKLVEEEKGFGATIWIVLAGTIYLVYFLV